MPGVAVSDSIAEKKVRCRRAARRRRDAQDAEQAAAGNARILARLKDLPAYREASAVLSYVAVRSEVTTQPILEDALRLGRAIWVPFIDDEAMAWAPISALDALAPGSMGIPEPVGAQRVPTAVPKDAVVLVPCLEFSSTGHRLGYGGGYFDRFLAGFTGTSIALAFEFQCNEALPVETHDLSVDYVVTDTRTITCLTSA